MHLTSIIEILGRYQYRLEFTLLSAAKL